MRNQKGHILPMTISISLLFTFIFIHQLNLYLLETKFYKETENLYKLDQIMMLTVKEVTTHTKAKVSKTVLRTYDDGAASYTITPQTETTSLVIITASSVGGGIYSAQFIYDFTTNTISKWIESR
ncbi:competence type IV pilus minor pilin ComGG [Litchfieldia salsa]|uniref:ComG operon protein 7 n=1 Tax=Litchfieldia salsa TaxID=930152 RepID=A0A1H0VDI7_9BACI|nr:competence type IV pilus minor pilin ComGG [Litchfieldia salsa]SDP76413.1 ComG operon protein 7 [Litchfieldia salsa]